MITVGGLRFEPAHPRVAGDECWVTHWPHVSGHDKEYYRVYRWKGGWAVSRPDHPVLGRLSDWRDKRRAAMELCGKDFEVVDRLHRWTEYMKTHEPPGVQNWTPPPPAGVAGTEIDTIIDEIQRLAQSTESGTAENKTLQLMLRLAWQVKEGNC